MKSRERTSAGGVAVRNSGGQIEIAVIRTSKESRWQLPKGIIDPGETPERAALREVREEAGIECELLGNIDSIDYWYVDRWGGEPVRVHKHVHFFLMKYIAGDIADHDDEVEDVQWAELNQAIELLSFRAEKEIVEKSRKMIS